MKEEWNSFEKEIMKEYTAKEISKISMRARAWIVNIKMEAEEELNGAYSDIAEGNIMIEAAFNNSDKSEKKMQAIQYLISKL